MADLNFSSYLQGPLGEAIQTVDPGSGPVPAAQFEPSLTLIDPEGGALALAGPKMRLLGPGDVAEVLQSNVVRMEPCDGAVDVEPNYLAALEVTPPELPWVLTPARPGAGRLRPWLVLVVVQADTTPLVPGGTLPSIQARVDELPDLRDSWGWTHVQSVVGGGDLPGGGHGLGSVARFLCPRRLEHNITYRACLVPAFSSGVAAGLGDPQAHDAPNNPAWDVATDDAVQLPVYLSWTFSTGPDGDFEQLVTRLGPADSQALRSSSTRAVDVRAPWPGDTPLADTVQLVGVPGALTPLLPPDAPQPSVTDSVLAAFDTRIRKQLDDPAQRVARGPTDDSVGSLAPPLYGGRHVSRDLVENDLVWLAQLNTAVANRIAAGLGADYVRANQEDLLAKAWLQVGAIREANRLRAVVELTTEVAVRMHARHVAPLEPGELVAFAAPAADRTRTASQTTLATEVRMSRLVDEAGSTAFARRVRPAGPVARSAGVTVRSILPRGLAGDVTVPAGARIITLGSVLAEPNGATSTVAATARQLVTMSALAEVATVNSEVADGSALVSRLGGLGFGDALMASIRAGDVSSVAAGIADDVEAVASMTARTITELSGTDNIFGAVSAEGVRISATGLAERLTVALFPGDSHRNRLASQIGLPEGLAAPRPGDPVMACPDFPVPTALTLLDTDPEWFLPGMGTFPMNRVALMQQNASFIESYLVGMNHEMMRELLWREYPTDRRGTPFTRFWPRPDGSPDIIGIHTWTDPTDLGGRLLQHDSLAVLLIRGDVLRRYPDMVVTAVRSAPPRPATPLEPPDPPGSAGRYHPSLTDTPIAPVFVIRVDGSTNAYAFDIPKAELMIPASPANPGWFFVMSEHGFRLRFGFDTIAPAELARWSDAAWPTEGITKTPATVPVDRDHAVAGLAFAPPTHGAPDDASWNHDAADIARIALQRPFRVATHAELLIDARSGEL